VIEADQPLHLPYLGHSFARPILERGQTSEPSRCSADNRDVTTTMIYTNVLNLGPAGVPSPLDPALMKAL
jgi:site-specific recombinase XerD